MATHGFIDIRFEGELDKDRTLVHAAHDGYYQNMMEDIITLPFFIAHFFKKEGYVDEKQVPKFLEDINHNHRHSIYVNFVKNPFSSIDSYKSSVRLWSNLIPLDEIRYSISNYLIYHRPDKYEVAQEPFILYGETLEEADIKIFFSKGRLSSLKIKLKDEEDSETISYLLDLIKNFNKILTEEDAKVKVLEDNTIIMNYDKMIVDLFFYKKI